MTASRGNIVNKLWLGSEPFAGAIMTPEMTDYQGWASDNPMLNSSIDEVQPGIILEVGVWKGGSVITMAEHLRNLGIDGVVIAVDTWLGASEHWLHAPYRPSLRIEAGYPSLFRTFAANIIGKGLQEYVVPLPLDSLNAAQVIKHCGISPNIIHIDGGHDFDSVFADLRVWWPVLAPGGILIGDDYHPTGIEVWPEVRAAFHKFFNVTEIENLGGKCVVRKPAA